jgi:hypothetical protein
MSIEARDRESRHENGPGPDGDRGHGDDHDHAVVVTVNGKPVKLSDREVTGAQIKKAAIDQGVQIQPNFILHRELPNGGEQIVGDRDRIKVRPKDRFTAIEPDDNS